MDISCYLVAKNGPNIKKVSMSEEQLIELANTLTTKGVEIVHLTKESIEVQGVYVAAKGFNGSLMVINK
jgi:predicted nucleic acid-binding protein